MTIITARVPPYSEESETGLIGAILLRGQSTFDEAVAAGVTAETFYVPRWRLVWETARALVLAGDPIDMLTVSVALRAADKIEQAGGQSALEASMDACAVPEHAGHYMQVCRDMQLRRDVITALRTAEVEACDGDDAEAARSRAEYALAELRQAPSERRTFRDLVAAQCRVWEQAQRTGIAGIPTGFQLFDRYCGGLLPAAYIVVSGTAGSGKTTLARNVAENLAMRGLPVEYFSLEQTGEQIAGAVAARQARQSVFWLNMGGRKCDLARLAAGAATVSDWPLTVHDQPMTRTALWSECRRAVSKRGARLIVLDYIQAVSDEPGARGEENETQRVSRISATCREIAKALKVPFIAVSSLSNNGALRGSGQIAYDCWVHVRLQCAEGWSPENLIYQATFEKQRFGPPGAVVGLRLIGDEQRFSESGRERDEPEEGGKE